MKKKNLAALLLAGAMCFGLLAGCGADTGTASDPADNSEAVSDAGSGESDSGTAGGTFQIGFIGPLTGDNASYGVSAYQGAQIAVDEINALGGDIQFELSQQDDVSDAETAVNAYNNLMDGGMQMLIGPVTTGPAISVAAETYNDRVFVVTPSASSLDQRGNLPV